MLFARISRLQVSRIVGNLFTSCSAISARFLKSTTCTIATAAKCHYHWQLYFTIRRFENLNHVQPAFRWHCSLGNSDIYYLEIRFPAMGKIGSYRG